MIFRVTIPPPPDALKPNRRATRMAKAKATGKYQHDTTLACKDALNRRQPPNWKQAVVMAVYRYTSQVPPDGDNLIASLKPAFDGLEQAGIIQNDRYLIVLPPEMERSQTIRAEVELVVQECTLKPAEIWQLIQDSS